MQRTHYLEIGFLSERSLNTLTMNYVKNPTTLIHGNQEKKL